MRALCVLALSPLASLASCTTAAAATKSDYAAALQTLHDGRLELTTALHARLAALPEVPIEQGLAGLTFDMTMQQVIDVWGKPNGIWTQDDGIVQLSIARSVFAFRDDRLRSISIHQADLPHLTIADGRVRMGEPAPDLQQLFPEGVIPSDGAADAHQIAVHGILIDLYESDGEIISIDLIKE
jgi:hypothetical protein